MPRAPLEDKPGQKPYGQRSSERRRQQNREAQRLLRERRAQHDAEVASKLKNQAAEIEALHTLVHELRCENARLKGEPEPPRPTIPMPSGSPTLPSVLARIPSSDGLQGRTSSDEDDGNLMRSAGFTDLHGDASRSVSPTLPNALALATSHGVSPPLQTPPILHMPPSIPPLRPSLASPAAAQTTPLHSPTTTLPPRLTTGFSVSNFFPHPGTVNGLTANPPIPPVSAESIQLSDLTSSTPNGMMFLADAVAQTLVSRSSAQSMHGSPNLAGGEMLGHGTMLQRHNSGDSSGSSGGSHVPSATDGPPRPAFHIPASSVDLADASSVINGLRRPVSFTMSPPASAMANDHDVSGERLESSLTPEQHHLAMPDLSGADDLPMGGGVWTGAGSFPWPAGRAPTVLGDRGLVG